MLEDKGKAMPSRSGFQLEVEDAPSTKLFQLSRQKSARQICKEFGINILVEPVTVGTLVRDKKEGGIFDGDARPTGITFERPNKHDTSERDLGTASEITSGEASDDDMGFSRSRKVCDFASSFFAFLLRRMLPCALPLRSNLHF